MSELTTQQLPLDSTTESAPENTSARSLFFKAVLITLGFLSFFILITSIVAGWFAWQQWQAFSNTSGVSFSELKQTIEAGWDHPIAETDGYKNVLLLGVDSLETRVSAPALTDTMIIVSLNLNSGVIKTLPLPRDIWSQEYQTKINALLVYGQERDPEDPTAFPTQVIDEITAVDLHQTVIISLDSLGQLIDTVGGIEVDVQQGFTDPQFPNPDVDVTTETDSEKLYQPISFEAGPQLMDGQRALSFIRSRYSPGEEGTDLARSKRQQQVITALANKITDLATLTNPTISGKLYRFYLDNFEDQIQLTEVVAMTRKLWPHRHDLRFDGNSLTVSDQDQVGVLEHPPVRPNQYQGQWVYLIPDLAAFQEEVRQLLF